MLLLEGVNLTRLKRMRIEFVGAGCCSMSCDPNSLLVPVDALAFRSFGDRFFLSIGACLFQMRLPLFGLPLALREMMRCNVCWLQLSDADRVYATQCSHVLCHDCSSKHFGRSQLTCPVCGTTLESHGLALIDLSPSSEKIKALCGLDPSYILQIASRAIDFYNFQSALAHAHDAQELETTKHCLQHQTQQHALTQKDLHTQLRTLKYQLEAIVSERDSQVRLVQELQSRLQTAQAQTAPSRPSMPPTLGHSHTLTLPTTQDTTSTPTYPVIFRREDENRGNREADNTSSRNAPLRPAWTSTHSNPMQHSTINKSYDTLPHTAPTAERRTRIFSSNSPAPIMPSNRYQAHSPSPNRGVTIMNHPQSDTRVMSSTPKHTTTISLNPPQEHASHATSSTLASGPSSSSRPPGNSSRFSALNSAPERPQTPLLHRLAGVSSNHPHL